MAVEVAILAFFKNEHKKDVRLMIDNVTAVDYLQNMGGVKSPECNTFQVQKTVLQILILGNSMIALSGWSQILYSKS